MLTRICDDLIAEYHELDAFVAALPGAAWARRTPFFDWTVRDQILHLQQVDRFALISLDSPARFADAVAEARAGQAAGVELSEQARLASAGQSDGEVLANWRSTYEALVAVLRAAEPGRRVKWFGPDMGLISLASARQMEVWAHGQDIYDLLDVRRVNTDRLRNVCEIGVRTFGWSFRNRGLDVPQRPAVTLVAPSGRIWEWPGEGEGSGAVTGPALDFALVVTQRRAPSDTWLLADGDAARHWLDIAQCFAGAPQEPAAAGERPSIHS